MRGKSLDNTRNVLSAALSKLDPDDSFSIIAFNGETYLFSTSMELATKEAVERANEWMSTNFVAGGGTNILLPLNQVFTHYYLFLCNIFFFFFGYPMPYDVTSDSFFLLLVSLM